MKSTKWITIVVGLALALAAGVTAFAPAEARVGTGHSARRAASTLTSPTSWTTKRLSSPDRVAVYDASGLLATFTVGARTVAMRGASRVFAEPSTTSAKITTTTWVRLLPQPFTGTVDTAWLSQALADGSPDVLATATQYIAGSPTLVSASGSLLASDAHYGPLQADGTRQEGSDFNDYLQVPWTYGNVVDQPETTQAESLDCSGFVRMVMGYRLGMPMTLDPDGVRLPRRAVQMATSAPGVVTVPNKGVRPTTTQLSSLQAGDLVLFDASTDDGTAIDHVGIFLGKDSTGAPRFISSRKTADGPTLGDVGGRSTLSGTGFYATAWREARRL